MSYNFFSSFFKVFRWQMENLITKLHHYFMGGLPSIPTEQTISDVLLANENLYKTLNEDEIRDRYHIYEFFEEILLNLSESTYEATEQSLKSNKSASTWEGFGYLLSILPSVIELRPNSTQLLISLTKSLLSEIKDETTSAKVRDSILYCLLHPRTTDDFNFMMKSHFDFLYQCMKNNIIPTVEIMNHFYHYLKACPQAKEDLCNMVIWFSPEIYSSDQMFFLNMSNELANAIHSRQPFSYPYRDFYQALEDLKENNWKDFLPKDKTPFLTILQADNCTQLKKYIQDPNKRIIMSVYSKHWYLGEHPTILQAACYFNAVECVNYLISLKNVDYASAAKYAVASGNVEIVKLFLEKETVNVQECGIIAIRFHFKHLFQYIGAQYKLGVKKLIFASTYTNNVNSLLYLLTKCSFDENNSCIHMAAAFGSAESFVILHNLLKVDLNKLSKTTESCLHLATKNGNISIVRYLVKQTNIDMNARNQDGMTPIQIAVQLGDFRMVKVLLANDTVDTNVLFSKHKMTLMHYAILKGNMEIVEILSHYDAFDINKGDENGDTPLHYATRNVNTCGTHLVVQMSAVDDSTLNTPEGYIPNYSKIIYKKILDTLFESPKLDPNILNNNGIAPIHNVCRFGRIDLFNIFKKYIDRVNYSIRTPDGKTILHIVAENGRYNLVSHIIQLPDFDKLAVDDYDMNAIHVAAACGIGEVLYYFTEDQEIDMNRKDKWVS